MAVTGTLSANGKSATLRVLPQETITASLICGGADTFIGTIAIEVSENKTVWAPAYSTTGIKQQFTAVDADNLGGTISSVTIKNENSKPVWYRVRVTGYNDDAVGYTLTPVTGDVVQEALLKDASGRVVIGVRDDGGLVLGGPLVSAHEGGALAADQLLYTDVTISAADIIATTAGKFGHAQGYPLVAAPGADEGIEFISTIMITDRAVAAYTGGGNITVNLSGGGAAQSGLIGAAATLGAAADNVYVFRPLTTVPVPIVANAGLNLVAAAAFTNPGTAAGVLRVRTYYRKHTLGLA